MVVSALCVLILLASYISSAGQAVKLPYNQATIESLLSMMNSADIGSGNAKMICNVECTRRYEVCIAAHDGDKLVDCGARITGNYTCLCSNPSRVTGAIPTGGIIVPPKSPVDKSCLRTFCKSGERCVSGKCVSIYKKAEVQGRADISTSSSSSSSGGYIGGRITSIDVSGFSPEARSTWDQLSTELQSQVENSGFSQEEINGKLKGCAGAGATGCVSEWMTDQAALIDKPTDTEVYKI